jgi:propanol-preferring alcohol dehydrogenase
VVVNDIPIPEPGEDQLLVKLASASLYHSVMMAIGGEGGNPVTLGHEGAGYVEKLYLSAIGKGFKEGRCRVLIHNWLLL